MAKKNKKRTHKKRHYIKGEQTPKIHTNNYFRQQADTINRLKPVIEAWKRSNKRAAQTTQDSRSAIQAEEGGE